VRRVRVFVVDLAFVALINWFVSAAAKGDLFLAGACKQITHWLSTLSHTPNLKAFSLIKWLTYSNLLQTVLLYY